MKSYSDKIILKDIGLYAIAFFYLWWHNGVFPPCRPYWTMRSVGGYVAVHLMIIMMMLVMIIHRNLLLGFKELLKISNGKKTLLSVRKCFFQLQLKCSFSRCHNLREMIVDDDVAIHQIMIVIVGGCFHLPLWDMRWCSSYTHGNNWNKTEKPPKDALDKTEN